MTSLTQDIDRVAHERNEVVSQRDSIIYEAENVKQMSFNIETNQQELN